jgi:hypothetical protein
LIQLDRSGSELRSTPCIPLDFERGRSLKPTSQHSPRTLIERGPLKGYPDEGEKTALMGILVSKSVIEIIVVGRMA